MTHSNEKIYFILYKKYKHCDTVMSYQSNELNTIDMNPTSPHQNWYINLREHLVPTSYTIYIGILISQHYWYYTQLVSIPL